MQLLRATCWNVCNYCGSMKPRRVVRVTTCTVAGGRRSSGRSSHRAEFDADDVTLVRATTGGPHDDDDDDDDGAATSGSQLQSPTDLRHPGRRRRAAVQESVAHAATSQPVQLQRPRPRPSRRHRSAASQAASAAAAAAAGARLRRD